MERLILVDSYFDGSALHADGPYAMAIDQGRIAALSRVEDAALSSVLKNGTPVYRAEFAMPGLVEAHAHVFLDGAELDLAARSEYLKASFESMLAVARRNLETALRHGVTLIRDAGDRYGVNHASRAATRGQALPTVRSAGLGIRRPARYGGFMAYEAPDDDGIVAVVHRIADEGADDLKIILTGIIDFATGQVKGEPQFDADALALAVATAHGRGLRTFAHCSGPAGLEVAVAAGVDSVEHGFFMSRDILLRMADRGIAWVPTCSPVHFQWARPEIVGWDAGAVGQLRGILDRHLIHIALAHDLGVELVAGSDAGSQGVPHGQALVDEIFFFLAAGVPLAAALEAATSRPCRLWGAEGGVLRVGAAADLVLLDGNPFQDPGHLRRVAKVFKNGQVADFAAQGAGDACLQA